VTALCLLLAAMAAQTIEAGQANNKTKPTVGRTPTAATSIRARAPPPGTGVEQAQGAEKGRAWLAPGVGPEGPPEPQSPRRLEFASYPGFSVRRDPRPSTQRTHNAVRSCQTR
jgi:hypothetical protein